MSNSSIWLVAATTSRQSGVGSEGNGEVLHIPQSSNVTDGLVSYSGHIGGTESHPSAEMQSVYSTASAD